MLNAVTDCQFERHNTVFIVAPCVLKSIQFTHQQIHYLLNLEKFKIYIKIYKYRSYMFRSTIIIKELVLNLAKVIFMLKHSVKLRRYMLCGDAAACCHITT